MCSAGHPAFACCAVVRRGPISGGLPSDKILALSNLCFAIPLAVFGAEHLSGARFIMLTVPSYMPWRLFGRISSALRCWPRPEHCHKNSGALVRLAVRDHDVSFCGDGTYPASSRQPQGQIAWVIVFREISFGGGGWILAGNAMRGQGESKLITVGRV